MANPFEHLPKNTEYINNGAYNKVQATKALWALQDNGFSYIVLTDEVKVLDTINVHTIVNQVQDDIGMWKHSTCMVTSKTDIGLSFNDDHFIYLINLPNNQYIALHKLRTKEEASEMHAYEGEYIDPQNEGFIITSSDDVFQPLVSNSLHLWVTDIKNYLKLIFTDENNQSLIDINIYPHLLAPVKKANKYLNIKVTESRPRGQTPNGVMLNNDELKIITNNIDTIEIIGVNYDSRELNSILVGICQYVDDVVDPHMGVISTKPTWTQVYDFKQSSFGVINNVSKLTLQVNYIVINDVNLIIKQIKEVGYGFNGNTNNS